MTASCDIHMMGASPNVIFPIGLLADVRQSYGVLSQAELLAELQAREVTQIAIARVLNVDPSQISQLYRGKRQLKLDEARRLVETFGLASSTATPPISEQVARLLILHVANKIGRPLASEDDRVQELALDFQAFSQFARTHRPAPSPDAALGFLEGRNSERPAQRQAR